MARIPIPNYTQCPNVLLDHMAEMGNAELRIVMAIARKTFGWQKRMDKISLSQLTEITGLSRQGVIDGTEKAISNGWLERKESGNSFVYSLIVEEDASQASRPKMVKPVDHLLVKPVDTQNKEVNKEQTDSPRKRGSDPLLQSLSEKFVSLTGIPWLDPKSPKDWKKANARWISPLKTMIETANGSSEQVMAEAIRRMRKDGLTISAPASVLEVFTSVYGERHKEQSVVSVRSDPFASLSRALAERNQ